MRLPGLLLQPKYSDCTYLAVCSSESPSMCLSICASMCRLCRSEFLLEFWSLRVFLHVSLQVGFFRLIRPPVVLSLQSGSAQRERKVDATAACYKIREVLLGDIRTIGVEAAGWPFRLHESPRNLGQAYHEISSCLNVPSICIPPHPLHVYFPPCCISHPFVFHPTCISPSMYTSPPCCIFHPCACSPP